MYRIFFVLIIIMISGSAHASTFDKYLQRLKDHPQIKTILTESERQDELAEGELGLPDPTVSLGVNSLPTDNFSFDKERMTSKVIEFNQEIPSYSLRKARSGMHEAESDKQKLMAGYAEAQLKALLIKHLVQLKALDDLESEARKQLKLYTTIEEYLQGQMEAGNPVYGRFSEFDVERVEVEHELNKLLTERRETEEELRWLVGEVPNIPALDIPHTTWNGDTKKLYPVLIAKENISVAKSGVDEADAAFEPNYGIRTAYMQRDSVSGNNLSDTFTIKASISIPLWASSNQKPKLRAAKAKHRSVEYTFEDTKRQWVKKMNVLQSELDILLKNIQVLEEKEAALNEVIASAERNYESGEASFDNLLEAQIDQLTLTKRLTRHHSHHKHLMAQINSHIKGGSHENN